MSQLTGHPLVDAIAQIHLEGDITPRSWYKHICYQTIKTEQCKADRLAVDILSDIVYWYRPSEIRDEITGEFVGWKKKFAGEILKRSPDAFAESLNATVRCVRESIRLLENLGLITVVLKPVQTTFGVIPNVMHIEVIPEAIAKITHRVLTKEKPETLEKPLLTKWVTRDDEMGNKELRNGEQEVTKWESVHDENGNLSIYRDLTEINSEISPLTPQGEEKEKSFGFQIPEEGISNSPASLESKHESLQLTTSQCHSAQVGKPAHAGGSSVKTIIPAAPQDPFFAKHRRSSDVVWDWLPDGPWKVNGKLCASFVEAIANRWVSEYGYNLHTAKVNVQKHFRNELTNLPIEWEWYQSTYLHKAANVQTRKSHGMDTAKDEQEIIKHAAAFTPLPDEIRVTQSQSASQFIESVAPYAAPTIAAVQSQPIAQLESVATVEDNMWESIAQQTSEWEEQQKTQIPEGADNPAAYQNVVKADDRDFWANLRKTKSDDVLPAQPTAPMSIAQLIAAKSMPKWDREKEKEQKRSRTRIEHWNNLLASGLSSVMADATKQALAAGYIIVDNQVVEPEF